MASLTVSFRGKVTTQLQANSVPGSESQIANYAMLTMGGRIHHWEGEIVDGVLNIDNHPFRPIKKGDSAEDGYFNQLGWDGDVTDEMRKQGIVYNAEDDERIKSACILWIYKRHNENQVHNLKTDEVSSFSLNTSKCMYRTQATVMLPYILRRMYFVYI